MSSSLPQDLENLVYNFRFINFTYMPDFGTDKKGQQTQPFPIRVGQYLVEEEREQEKQDLCRRLSVTEQEGLREGGGG